MNTLVEIDVVRQAEAFVRLRFAEQMRGGKIKQPAYNHMREVAQLVDEAGGNDDEAAAAWLHDVLEDTKTTLNEIKEIFGPHVAMLVMGLTDPPGIQALEGVRTVYERKLVQAGRVANEPQSVKLVKLADQISNLRAVRSDPPEEWSKEDIEQYIRGSLEVCKHCFGISELLDSYFTEAYEAAERAYA